jgi:Domain of unknown function (DUF1918)
MLRTPAGRCIGEPADPGAGSYGSPSSLSRKRTNRRAESVIVRMAGVRGDGMMAPMEHSHQPQPGDVIAIHGHRVGEAERLGEVLEVLGEPGHEHLRVRWEDGHESVFYPSSDAVVRPRHTAGKRKS